MVLLYPGMLCLLKKNEAVVYGPNVQAIVLGEQNQGASSKLLSVLLTVVTF